MLLVCFLAIFCFVFEEGFFLCVSDGFFFVFVEGVCVFFLIERFFLSCTFFL